MASLSLFGETGTLGTLLRCCSLLPAWPPAGSPDRLYHQTASIGSATAPSSAAPAATAAAAAATEAAPSSSSRAVPGAGSDNRAASASSLLQSVPVERFQRAITPQLCEALRTNGYAVVDGVFGEEAAAVLREELRGLRHTPAMHKNHTHLVQGGSTGLLEKEHVWEAELMLQETQALAPLCSQLQHDGTLRTMLSVLMPELRLHSQAIKLQWNRGHGGCFPMHFDSDMALDTRRVTAIFYINPGWREGDGGELRLYPFPQAPVDVQPLNDRLVLFSSMHLLHRVLPAAAERYCFTIWLSEGGGNGRRPGCGGSGGMDSATEAERRRLRQALSSSEPLGAEEAWELLLHPELRKHAVKWHYREEWERSIRESHPAGPQLDSTLATFHRELHVVQRALAPLLPALAAGPPPGTRLPPIAWF